MPEYHKPNRPQPKRDRTVYNSAAWGRIRRRHLAANPACVGCGRAANEVDHIDGIVTNCYPENLQSFCKSCHSKKTARENGGLGR